MKPGDRVHVVSEDGEYEGILMPRPDLLDKNVVVLKLDSGYNVGIDSATIKKTKVVKPYTAKKTSGSKVKVNPKLPTVALLSTGGTISSKIDYQTGGVSADYEAADLLELCPELKTIANVKTKKIASLMSEDLVPSDWSMIAQAASEEIKAGAAGVVITHGTDTLHFTTAALSFALQDLSVPVIVTGSQRSIDRGSSDAFMNLICAIKAAAHYDEAGVMSCLHGSTNDDYCLLIRGTKVRKMHTSRRDSFRPINAHPVAKVFVDKDFEVIEPLGVSADRKAKKVTLKTGFSEHVALITIYPGLDPSVIDFYLDKGVKGIVIAATALGHVNTHAKKNLVPYLKKCYEKKVPVFITSQTIYGGVHPYVYSNLRKVSLEGHGIYLGDILSETAFVKLSWVLKQVKAYDKITSLMSTSLAGEISSRRETPFLN